MTYDILCSDGRCRAGGYKLGEVDMQARLADCGMCFPDCPRGVHTVVPSRFGLWMFVALFVFLALFLVAYVISAHPRRPAEVPAELS